MADLIDYGRGNGMTVEEASYRSIHFRRAAGGRPCFAPIGYVAKTSESQEPADKSPAAESQVTLTPRIVSTARLLRRAGPAKSMLRPSSALRPGGEEDLACAGGGRAFINGCWRRNPLNVAKVFTIEPPSFRQGTFADHCPF
jgi:hypothetical protein